MSVWFVTGASRGLGHVVVAEALLRGHQVVAGSRRPPGEDRAPSPEGLLQVRLDVTDADQVIGAVQAAVDAFGRIDVLVNNAGHGVLGAVEEVSDAEALGMFEVNVFGVHRTTRAVLPVMRRQRSGRILMIGSGGGFASSAAHGLYGATKFAVEALTESLALETRELGIHPTVVELGAFRTDFFGPGSIRAAEAVVDDYAATPGGAAAREGFLGVHGRQPGDPRRAAAALLELAEMDEPPLRVQLGRDSLARVERKLAFVASELERWRALARSTDFDDTAAFRDPGHVT